jgi:septum formation protein
MKSVPMAEPGGARAPLILASASAGRAAVLRDAGLSFRQVPTAIDEREMEAKLAQDGVLEGDAVALMLAAAKAEHVSRTEPGALVIGADQVMSCDGRLYQKPPSVDAAREQLRELRGKSHTLHAGLAVARGGETLWRHLGVARLTMRDFSDAFLDAYVEAEGEALTRSVGAYRIEGLGIQLFSRVEGDHFTIIGLPLLPLLDYLRECGWLRS